MFRTCKIGLLPSFNQVLNRNFCTATVFNTIPLVQPVNVAYKMYTKTDVDNGVPPLIIMHGLFGSKKNWKNISDKLQQNLKPRRQIFTVDARNHGDSPHSPFHTYAHLAQDIVELLKQQSIERAAVIGHSMGGRAMMYLALNFPHIVDRAVIVDTTPFNHPRGFTSTDFILNMMKSIVLSPELSEIQGKKQAAETLLRTLSSPALVDYTLQNLKKLGNGNFAWKLNISALESNMANMNRFPENVLNSQQYRGQILLIGGSKSDFVRSTDLSVLKNAFPKIRLHWIDSGHLIHFEKPAEFASLVIKFLS